MCRITVGAFIVEVCSEASRPSSRRQLPNFTPLAPLMGFLGGGHRLDLAAAGQNRHEDNSAIVPQSGKAAEANRKGKSQHKAEGQQIPYWMILHFSG
jgi:hypothetical protein